MQKAEVRLINLPQPNSLDDRLDPPLGLMYLAAALESKGIEVEIIDLPFVARQDWQKEIGNACFYGITVYSASFYLAKEVARIAKQNNPESKIIIGGIHPTALPEESLQNDENFDIAVEREGEETILEIVTKKELDEIKGIVYKNKGKIIRNDSRPLIKNLDGLPFPARHLLDIPAYTRKVNGGKTTSLITSRGCPLNCSFCCKDVFGSEVRFRSIPNVISEIKQIIDKYGIRHFLFYDDTFVLNRKRLYPLCEELAKLDIVFRCNGNARYNNFEDYKILYKAGCREIAFGIESGSQKILNLIHKGVTVQQNEKAIVDAKRAGLIVKAYLMVGNPGETNETVEETKKFIEKTDPDQFTLFTFVPLPGCDIWKNPAKYGIEIINRDFAKYFNIAGNNDGGVVIKTDSLTPQQIIELREDLLKFLKKRGQRGILQDYYKKIYEYLKVNF